MFQQEWDLLIFNKWDVLKFAMGFDKLQVTNVTWRTATVTRRD